MRYKLKNWLAIPCMLVWYQHTLVPFMLFFLPMKYELAFRENEDQFFVKIRLCLYLINPLKLIDFYSLPFSAHVISKRIGEKFKIYKTHLKLSVYYVLWKSNIKNKSTQLLSHQKVIYIYNTDWWFYHIKRQNLALLKNESKHLKIVLV